MPQQQHPRLRPAPIPLFPSGQSSATNPVNPMHVRSKAGKRNGSFGNLLQMFTVAAEPKRPMSPQR